MQAKSGLTTDCRPTRIDIFPVIQTLQRLGEAIGTLLCKAASRNILLGLLYGPLLQFCKDTVCKMASLVKARNTHHLLLCSPCLLGTPGRKSCQVRSFPTMTKALLEQDVRARALTAVDGDDQSSEGTKQSCSVTRRDGPTRLLS